MAGMYHIFMWEIRPSGPEPAKRTSDGSETEAGLIRVPGCDRS